MYHHLYNVFTLIVADENISANSIHRFFSFSYRVFADIFKDVVKQKIPCLCIHFDDTRTRGILL